VQDELGNISIYDMNTFDLISTFPAKKYDNIFHFEELGKVYGYVKNTSPGYSFVDIMDYSTGEKLDSIIIQDLIFERNNISGSWMESTGELIMNNINDSIFIAYIRDYHVFFEKPAKRLYTQILDPDLNSLENEEINSFDYGESIEKGELYEYKYYNFTLVWNKYFAILNPFIDDFGQKNISIYDFYGNLLDEHNLPSDFNFNSNSYLINNLEENLAILNTNEHNTIIYNFKDKTSIKYNINRLSDFNKNDSVFYNSSHDYDLKVHTIHFRKPSGEIFYEFKLDYYISKIIFNAIDNTLITFSKQKIEKWGDLPNTVEEYVNNYEEIVAVPNPFDESTKLEFESQKVGAAELVISDLNGRNIEKRTVGIKKGMNSININSQEMGLSNGVYFVEIKGSGLNLGSRIILK